MSVDITKRRWGVGELKYAVISTGEVPLETLLSGGAGVEVFGATAEGIEFDPAPDIQEDEVDQELLPVQIFASSFKPTLKTNLATGDADQVAIIAGYDQPTTVQIGGVDYSAVVGGAVSPKMLSLLLIVRNPHDPTKADLLYIPRAQVEPKPTFTYRKDGVRQQEVVFHVLPSEQSAFQVGGQKMGWMYVEGVAVS